jgi:hypothetical protein
MVSDILFFVIILRYKVSHALKSTRFQRCPYVINLKTCNV